MNIALGSDHRGIAYKQAIADLVSKEGHSPKDFGPNDTNSVDYPDFAQKVAEAVAAGTADLGVLICGSGIGMSIAANKVNGVRAALCYHPFAARLSRQHNNANVVCLGQDMVGQGIAEEIVRVFISTKFEGDRHQRRLDKITALE